MSGALPLAERDVETLGELLQLLNPENKTLADFLADLADEAALYPDFSDMEDLTKDDEEAYKDKATIVVEIGNYVAHQEAGVAIAALLDEHPDWEASIAA